MFLREVHRYVSDEDDPEDPGTHQVDPQVDAEQHLKERVDALDRDRGAEKVNVEGGPQEREQEPVEDVAWLHSVGFSGGAIYRCPGRGRRN